MENKFKGEGTTVIGGEKLTLCFDWSALAAIETECGPKAISDLYVGVRPVLLAKIAAAGLKKHHPEMTVEGILAASPVYMKLRADVDRVLAYALYGEGDAPKPGETPKPPKTQEQSKAT